MGEKMIAGFVYNSFSESSSLFFFLVRKSTMAPTKRRKDKGSISWIDDMIIEGRALWFSALRPCGATKGEAYAFISCSTALVSATKSATDSCSGRFVRSGCAKKSVCGRVQPHSLSSCAKSGFRLPRIILRR